MPGDARPSWDPVCPAVALTSLAILLLELALTRLFSATMLYHYGFLAISLALFGSGAAGVAVYLGGRFAHHQRLRWAARAAQMFALTTPLALAVVLRFPLRLDGGWGNLARVALLYPAVAVPFFFGGAAVTLAVAERASVVHRLYRYDLLGAALGGLALVPLLDRLGGVDTILVVPIVAAAAATLYALSEGGSGVDRMWSLVLGLGMAALLGVNVATGWVDAPLAPGWRAQDLLFSRWNSFSRVTVRKTETPALDILIDSGASTSFNMGAGDRQRYPQMRDQIGSLPYRITHEPRVLIIGPGGGGDVILARLFNARSITAVEINPLIARDIMNREPFVSFGGFLYQQPDVHLVVDDARSYVARSRESFDVIEASMVDTWAATAAGAFALTESHLYTVEAFVEDARRLSDDGVLAFTRWYFEPPDQILRLVSLVRAMMSRLGLADPARHLVVARAPMGEEGRTYGIVLFKKSPLTDDETRALETFLWSRDDTLLFSPRTRPDNLFTRLIEADRPESVTSTLPTNVAPVTDDSPFFFNSVRPTDLLHVGERVPEWRRTNLGTVVLLALFAVAAVLVTLFIAGPLAVARRRDLRDAGGAGLLWLAYFGSLGAGFMLIEIALVQRCVLFLGPPVYALTVVLVSLLAFSAFGSEASGRIGETRLPGALWRILLVAAGGALLYGLGLGPLLGGLVSLARPVRLVVAGAAVAPLAFVLGAPMPSGLRLLNRRAPALLPWAWGLNAACSVLGSIGALLVALFAGFRVVLLLAAALYLVAALLVRRLSPAS